MKKEIYIKPSDCCNLAKEYEGQNNWCIIKDMPCPMIYGLQINEWISYSPSELNPCKLKGELEGITVLPSKAKKKPDSVEAIPEGKYRKMCKRCNTHFRIDAKNKAYCVECTDKQAKQRYREYNHKR